MDERVGRALMVGLALLGLGISGYLTYTHYADVQVACSLGGQCETVQHSAYAALFGIPVAVLGIAGYALILTSLIATNEAARLLTVALVVPGFGFSAYLTYRELFSIHAICPWCVSSAVIMTLLAGLAIWRYLREPQTQGSAINAPQSSALKNVCP